jgi:hypothetical protein
MLLVGDAGQGRWEEVSLVEKGGNYGWNVKEGTHCFNATASQAEPASCPSVVESGVRMGDPLVDPVIEYANVGNTTPTASPKIGVVVVGGVVYRGQSVKELDGHYVFGDWSKSFFGPPDGTLLAATPRARAMWHIQELRVATSPDGRLHRRILGFGQDDRGEVYIGTTLNSGPSGFTGAVLKIVGPDGQER